MDWRDIERAAVDQGWRVERTKKGLGLYPPDPAHSPVFWHGTPSDVRAIRNMVAEMRRRGFIWPPRLEDE